MDLTVIILTFNEERHIERCLDSIAGLGRVIVVDSYSTDRTIELARARGAEILQHPFSSQAQQFQWALDHAQITTPWVMRLDADEVIEADLKREIEAKLPTLPPDVVGVNLKRKHIFLDRWIRHGGRYPLLLLRIWRAGHGRVEDRWMDEHMIVWGGATVTFEGGFADHNLNDLTYFTDKHNKYATREAIEVLTQKYDLLAKAPDTAEGASKQAAFKRLLKEKIYNHMPFWMGPSAYFLYRYFIKLGFLDGREGLIYHFLQGGWYRFLVGAKVFEFDRELAGCGSREDRLARLEQLTGYVLRRPS